MRARGQVVLAAVALLATGTLSACSEPEPARWEAREVQGLSIPAIDWPRGAPDTSNEWVAALYESLAADAAATNNADYSSPYLQQLFEPDKLAHRAEDAYSSTDIPWAIGGGDSPYYYYRGVKPLTIEEVVVEGDYATVLVCIPSQIRWLTTEDDPVTVEDIANNHDGYYNPYPMVRENGTIRQSVDLKVAVDYNSECDASGAKPGYFDPEPDYGSQVDTYTFLGTDGTPYYLSDPAYTAALERGWTPENGWPQDDQ